MANMGKKMRCKLAVYLRMTCRLLIPALIAYPVYCIFDCIHQNHASRFYRSIATKSG